MAIHLKLAADPGPVQRPSITVVLADDHTALRRSIRLILDTEQDLAVVAEAADLSTVVRHVHGHLPHVLVLDLEMPNGSSIQTIRRLRTSAPATKIVVLSMEDSPAFAREALEAGAIGFVLKHHAESELPEAVRRAACGEQFVSARVAAALAALRRGQQVHGLSERELEILRLVALGYTSAEIADKLHLSRRTVETHRARIHRKLGLRTRADLVQYALRDHLIGV